MLADPWRSTLLQEEEDLSGFPHPFVLALLFPEQKERMQKKIGLRMGK